MILEFFVYVIIEELIFDENKYLRFRDRSIKEVNDFKIETIMNKKIYYTK
jgi:hypothetical protein